MNEKNIEVGFCFCPRPAIIVLEGRRPILERDITESELNRLNRWTVADLEKASANFERKGIEVKVSKGGLYISRQPMQPEVIL